MLPVTYLPEITIYDHGRITPEIGLIECTEFAYSSTDDVNGYVIRILENNVPLSAFRYILIPK